MLQNERTPSNYSSVFTPNKIDGSAQVLEATIDTERLDFQRRLDDKDASTNNTQKAQQEELDTIRDERDELQQRLRMTERQLARLRKPEVCSCVAQACR